MNSTPDDPRLSAYLDGELSPTEQADVERQLAHDPRLARLLEDLRRQRQLLANLPRFELGADFAARVLAQAEREVLTGARGDEDDTQPSGPLAAAPSRPRVERLGDEALGGWSWRRAARPLAWSGAAIAAALLLSFFGPQTDRTGPSLAVHQETDGQERVDEMPMLSAPEASLDRDRGMMAKSAAGRGEMADDSAAEAGSETSRGFVQPQTAGQGLADQPASPDAPATASNQVAPAAVAAPMAARAAAGDGAGDSAITRQVLGLPAAGAAGVLVVQCDMSCEAAENRAFEAVLEQQKIVFTPAAGQEPAATPPATAETAPQDAGPSEPAVSETADAAAVAADARATDRAAAGSAGEGAAAGGAQPMPAQPTTPAQSTAPAPETLAETPEPTSPETSPRGAEAERDLAAEMQDADPASVAPVEARVAETISLTEAGDIDVVYVEATPQQLAGTLEALSAEPSQFINVSVLPAPDSPQQQDLTQYNRIGAAGQAQLATEDLWRRELERRGRAAPGDAPHAERVLLLRRGQMRAAHRGPAAAAAPPGGQPSPAESAGQTDPSTALQPALFVLRVLDPRQSPTPPPAPRGPAAPRAR